MFIWYFQNSILIVLVYIDDIIVIGSSTSQISKLIQFLASNFTLKDLGNLHYFLGIKATRAKDNLFLTQTKYIKDLLQWVKMIEAKHIAIPTATKQISPYDGTPFPNETLYRSAIGS